jgi:L-threonylcarbamoyladenylate synthase
MLSLVSGFEMAFRYVEPPHGASRGLLLKHWPGPLTAIFRARSHVPPEFCGPGDTIAFRWPQNSFLQALIGALGVPVLSTSANRSGEPPLADFEDIERKWSGSVDALVDGGTLDGVASTIVDLTAEAPIVVRMGAAPL